MTRPSSSSTLRFWSEDLFGCMPASLMVVSMGGMNSTGRQVAKAALSHAMLHCM